MLWAWKSKEIDNKKCGGSVIQHKFTAGKPNPPFPGQKPMVTAIYLGAFQSTHLYYGSPCLHCVLLEKGPDVAVRKKHSDISWFDF